MPAPVSAHRAPRPLRPALPPIHPPAPGAEPAARSFVQPGVLLHTQKGTGQATNRVKRDEFGGLRGPFPLQLALRDRAVSAPASEPRPDASQTSQRGDEAED